MDQPRGRKPDFRLIEMLAPETHKAMGYGVDAEAQAEHFRKVFDEYVSMGTKLETLTREIKNAHDAGSVSTITKNEYIELIRLWNDAYKKLEKILPENSEAIEKLKSRHTKLDEDAAEALYHLSVRH